MTRGGDGGVVFVFCLGKGGDDGGLTETWLFFTGERCGSGWLTALVRGCRLVFIILLGS